MANDAPLGVFDSGSRRSHRRSRAARGAPERGHRLPRRHRARPYGTKGPATVIKYALGCAASPRRAAGVKAIVIACNTVSAVAPDRLRIELDLPVLGVIEPGARAAVEATRNGKIGVLATAATIASGAYPRAVSAISTRAETIGQAAPLLVPARRRRVDRRGRPAARGAPIPRAARQGGRRRRRPRLHALPAPAPADRGRGARADRRARRAGGRQRARGGDGRARFLESRGLRRAQVPPKDGRGAGRISW